MTKLPELGVLFRVVAIVEFAYAAIGLLTPPHLVYPLTGWSLSADGQWVTKLLAVALLSQAWIAWTMRNQPHQSVALALALYQVGSATADWVMWLSLADQGVFATALARAGVIVSIPLHYAIGILLLLAVAQSPRRQAVHG
jgi:hypothetical protein